MNKKYKIGILRVLTTEDSKILTAHQKILENLFSEFEYETKCIPDQYEGIHDEVTYNAAFPKIIDLASKWENDIDGLIVSCAGDPAVRHLQDTLSIPVVGAGISAASLSLNYGEKVGIIGIEEYPPPAYEDILGNRIIGYELPEGIENTNDLQTEKGRESIVESAMRLKGKGCDVIVFACTGLSTANAVDMLKDIGIPVVDAVVAEGTIMKYKITEKSMRESICVQNR